RSSTAAIFPLRRMRSMSAAPRAISMLLRLDSSWRSARSKAQRLLCFETLRVILLGDEERKEHGTQSAFAGTRQIEVPVGGAVSNISAKVELSVDSMYVTVKDQRLRMQGFGAFRDLSGQIQGNRKQIDQTKKCRTMMHGWPRAYSH